MTEWPEQIRIKITELSRLRENDECLKLIKYELESWISKQGHDSCWYYPDIFNKLCEILEIEKPNQNLPLRCEFEKGCRKYQNEVYS